MYSETYYWISSNFIAIITEGIIGFSILRLIESVKPQKYAYKIFVLLTGLVYLAFLLYVTLGMRTESVGYDYNLHLFWSYQYIRDTGERWLLWENFANLLCFVPLGMILQYFLKGWLRWFGCAGICLVASSLIEVSQLYFKLGMFEFDDMFHNTLGGLIGFAVASVIDVVVRKLGVEQ